MTRWFATDRDGSMAVFESGAAGAVPQAVADPERGEELTLALSRELRRATPPTPGSHANVRAGTVLMLGEVGPIRSWAEHVESHAAGVIVARFPRARGGRPASFMPSIRTFGAGDESPSAFEQVHALGMCKGCLLDRGNEELDEQRLVNLGFYVYISDDELLAAPYRRALTPTQPLHSDRVGKLLRRFAKFPGAFAAHDAIQPIEHWKKVAVEPAAWLGSDGTVRCVQGRALDYAEEYKFLKGEYANVEEP